MSDCDEAEFLMLTILETFAGIAEAKSKFGSFSGIPIMLWLESVTTSVAFLSTMLEYCIMVVISSQEM